MGIKITSRLDRKLLKIKLAVSVIFSYSRIIPSQKKNKIMVFISNNLPSFEIGSLRER